MVKKFWHCAVAVTLMQLGLCDAPAAVIVNGDFETVSNNYVGIVRNTPLDALGTSGNARWDVYTSIPGWFTPSGQGPGIEIQTDGTVVNGHSSNHYVELDSHTGSTTNSAMAQNISFSQSGSYVLGYWFHARTSRSNDNGINVYLDDLDPSNPGDAAKLVGSTLIDDPSLGWIHQSVLLPNLTAGVHQIKFWATGRDNSRGGFLDDVTVDAVPEPAALLIWLGLGLAGFVLTRRRRRAG